MSETAGLARRVAVADRRAGRHTEQTIQRLRVVSLVPAVAQAIFYPGTSRYLAVLAVLVIAATCLWTEVASSREAGAGLVDRSVVWTGIFGDIAAVAILMTTHRSNPDEAVQVLPLLVTLEAAARWDRLGGVIGGVVGGLAAALWTVDVHHSLGLDVSAVSLVFRVTVFMLVGWFTGMLVRDANQERRAAEAVFNASRDLVVTFGLDGKVRAVNPASQVILGYAPEELVGQDRALLVAPGEPNFGEVDVEMYRREGDKLVETCLLHRDGHRVWLEVDLLPDLDAGVVRAIGRDVSHRRQAEHALRHRVDHDGLTGLWNRDAMLTHLDDLLSSGRSAALVFVDLDRFKAVNDVHGHVAGDQVLREIGSRLVEAGGAETMVARYAGDEFCLVIDDAAGLADVLARSRDAMATPFSAGEVLVEVGASFGPAVARPGDRPEMLVHRADKAMYADKAMDRASLPENESVRD